MKIQLSIRALVSVLILVCQTLYGEEESKFPSCSYRTPVMDNYYMIVANDLGTEHTLWNQKFCIAIRTVESQNVSRVWFPLALPYRYEVELVDARSNSVSKTFRGKKVGRKFFELAVSSDGITSQASPRRMTAFATHERGAGFFEMFCPSDYFDIKDAGNYTLRLRLQMVGQVGTGTNEGLKVIRFPAIEIPVTKGK